MAENNKKIVNYSTPFSLQSLCRLSLMPGFRITDCPNTKFISSKMAEGLVGGQKQIQRNPRCFESSEAIHLLGHAAKMNCLKSVTLVNIDRLDFGSVSQSDLENFLSVVKYNLNVKNVLSIEKLFSAAKGVVPFGEEETCVHHNRQICTKCSRKYCKDYYCPCQVMNSSIDHYN